LTEFIFVLARLGNEGSLQAANMFHLIVLDNIKFEPFYCQIPWLAAIRKTYIDEEISLDAGHLLHHSSMKIKRMICLPCRYNILFNLGWDIIEVYVVN
jgi:hypothetical protein